jgi:hypothetical protein
MINVQNPNLMDKVCLQSYIYGPIREPMAMLKDFFSYQDLQAHLKKLKQWRNVVANHSYFEISTEINPLYEHKMMCNLLNAAYLLHESTAEQERQANELSTKEQDKLLNHECLNANFYPKHLNTSELIDPYLGIEKVFEYFTLQYYHEQLYEWLNIGFSPNVQLEDEAVLESVYRNLCILIESCWLIDRRNAEESLVTAARPAKAAVMEEESDESESIPPHVLAEFKKFLTVVPPDRLNRGLRKMLVDYLFYNIEGLPTDFEELLSDFYWLTDLLDEIHGKTLDPKFT